MAYIQTEVLADCHLIFKVDGTGERYSSAPSHARCTPFLSVSMVPDHISPGNLILTFRTPARDCTSYFSSCTPSLLLAVFLALFCFSASVCLATFIFFVSMRKLRCSKCNRNKFSARIISIEMPNGISCVGPIRFSIQFLIYYIFTFLLRPTTESFELRKNRALADESFRIFRGRR